MRILITGATGMVGRNLSDTCPAQHDLLKPTSKELNLLSKEQVASYLKAHRPDMIIHCAGRVGGIQENINHPVEFLRENTLMADHLINAAKELRIKKMINLGSSCMYPREAVNPLKEESLLSGPFEPTNEGYAIAKSYAYKLCDFISNTDEELSYKTIVPCNLYGKWDKFDPIKSHLIPAIVLKVLESKRTGNDVVIWGTGSVRREFMYATDFAGVVWQLVDKFDQMPSVMNVGIGYDHSIKEYYEKVAEVLGYEAEFQYDTTKPEGMRQKLVDISIMNQLGVKSTYDLETGIRETYQYYQELLANEN